MAEMNDYPWTHPPANWSDARIVGVYVGLEATGHTWSYVRMQADGGTPLDCPS